MVPKWHFWDFSRKVRCHKVGLWKSFGMQQYDISPSFERGSFEIAAVRGIKIFWAVFKHGDRILGSRYSLSLPPGPAPLSC